MDSLIVVNQMLCKFKIKNRDLCPIYDSIKKLSESFGQITFTHVPRELNKLADRMVNKALDEHLRNN
jgi:ribonuclease HI